MSKDQLKYIMDHQLHDLKMKDPLYRQLIYNLSKIYANDKDVYNATLAWLHSFDCSAYIEA